MSKELERVKAELQEASEFLMKNVIADMRSLARQMESTANGIEREGMKYILNPCGEIQGFAVRIDTAVARLAQIRRMQEDVHLIERGPEPTPFVTINRLGRLS